MEVFDAIMTRKSVRAYGDEPVPDEVLERILESARISPSAANYQPWHFIVVRDKEKRAALAEGKWARFLKEAPVVIVGCGDRKKSPKWNAVDVSIAMQTMVLQATSEGLGTCWIGSFDEVAVKALLKIPENYGVVALLALGYPREKIDLTRALVGKRRKALAEITSAEEFGKPLK
ncbi:MAG: nitroreductase family protein [Methanobacteriota archaeon]